MSQQVEYKGEFYPVREKSGEATGTPLFQVESQRYVESWQSTPIQAIEVYLRVKDKVDKGYYSSSSANRNSKSSK